MRQSTYAPLARCAREANNRSVQRRPAAREHPIVDFGHLPESTLPKWPFLTPKLGLKGGDMTSGIIQKAERWTKASSGYMRHVHMGGLIVAFGSVLTVADELQDK